MEMLFRTCETEPLSIEGQSLIKCLQKLSLAKCDQLIVNWVISEELDDMINYISLIPLIMFLIFA